VRSGEQIKRLRKNRKGSGGRKCCICIDFECADTRNKYCYGNNYLYFLKNGEEEEEEEKEEEETGVVFVSIFEVTATCSFLFHVKVSSSVHVRSCDRR